MLMKFCDGINNNYIVWWPSYSPRICAIGVEHREDVPQQGNQNESGFDS